MPLHPERSGSPTVIRCLQCQLLGRRRFLCAQRDACARLPVVFPLGPLLLIGWFVAAAAFLLFT